MCGDCRLPTVVFEKRLKTSRQWNYAKYEWWSGRGVKKTIKWIIAKRRNVEAIQRKLPCSGKKSKVTVMVIINIINYHINSIAHYVIDIWTVIYVVRINYAAARSSLIASDARRQVPAVHPKTHFNSLLYLATIFIALTFALANMNRTRLGHFA